MHQSTIDATFRLLERALHCAAHSNDSERLLRLAKSFREGDMLADISDLPNRAKYPLSYAFLNAGSNKEAMKIVETLVNKPAQSKGNES